MQVYRLFCILVINNDNNNTENSENETLKRCTNLHTQTHIVPPLSEIGYNHNHFCQRARIHREEKTEFRIWFHLNVVTRMKCRIRLLATIGRHTSVGIIISVRCFQNECVSVCVCVCVCVLTVLRSFISQWSFKYIERYS